MMLHYLVVHIDGESFGLTPPLTYSDANLVIIWSRNPYIKTPIPGKPSKSGLIEA